MFRIDTGTRFFFASHVMHPRTNLQKGDPVSIICTELALPARLTACACILLAPCLFQIGSAAVLEGVRAPPHGGSGIRSLCPGVCI